MEKAEILKKSLNARIDEVMGYQINIDNYTLAITEIDKSGDEDLMPFRELLEGLLKSEIIEQKKAKIMLEVLRKQVEPC